LLFIYKVNKNYGWWFNEQNLIVGEKYTFYYTQKQVNNIRKSLYALEINRTITQYLENQNKIKSNKKNNNNVIECEIELDF
jgi:DNA-binding transcriptional regulator GbsR (MarR family)